MALKACKECGKEISSSAKTCPHCGKKQKHTFLFLFAIIFVAFFGMIVGTAMVDPSLLTSIEEQEEFTLLSDKKVVDSIGTTYIEGEIKNNTNKTYSYVQVTFNLYDENGSQLGTAVDNINYLDPNATWKYKALGLVTEDVASYKFVEITGW